MRKKPGPKPGSKRKVQVHGYRGFIQRHKYGIATAAVVGAGVAGIVAAAKALPVGAATAVGIAIGYLTVTAVGGIGAMAMRDGQFRIAATLEKQAVASG